MPKSILKKPKADLKKKPKTTLKKPKTTLKKPKTTLKKPKADPKKPKATSIDKLNIILNEELNNITSEKIKRHNNGGFESKLFEKKFLNNLKLRSQPKKKSDNDKIQYGNTTNYGIRNNYERPNYGTKNRFEENSNYGIKNQFKKKSITKSLNYRR